MATETITVPFHKIEAMEKKGWIATNQWSIKDYTVTMEKVSCDPKKDKFQPR